MSLLVKLVGSAFITASAGGGIYAGVVSQSSNNTSLTSSSHTETLQKEPIQESTSLEQTLVASQTQDTNSHQEEQVRSLNSQVTPSNPSQEEQRLEEHKTETTEEGNCKVVTDLEKVIGELSLSTSSYVSITCDTQGIIEPEDVSLSPKWTALFPRDFFVKNGGQITSGHKLTIKTDTNVSEEEDGETYRTVFKSDSFSSSNGNEITGRWDYGGDVRGGKTVDPVRVVSPATEEQIYFVRASSEDEE